MAGKRCHFLHNSVLILCLFCDENLSGSRLYLMMTSFEGYCSTKNMVHILHVYCMNLTAACDLLHPCAIDDTNHAAIKVF